MGPLSGIQFSPLLSGVDEPMMSRIEAALTAETWEKGHQIFGPSDSVARFRLMLDGRVKIVRSNHLDGREFTLWLLGPGDGFDVVSLLDGEPHAVSAWAIDRVHTLGAPMALWREWLDTACPLRLAIHRYIAERMREITEVASDLALHDTAVRLSHLLLRHFDGRTGPERNLLRGLPQRELAALLGTVRVIVSRALGQLRRQGIVDLEEGAVRTVDLQRLLALAESQRARRSGGPAAVHGGHR